MIRKSRLLLVLIASALLFGVLATPAFADHTILSGPAEGATVTSNVVTFTWSGAATATYECMVDDGAWVACSSPYSYSAPNGPNRFKLKSSAGHSNPGAQVIKRTFTVDAVATTPVTVSSVSAGCAGDTITATAEASGSSGQTFSLALHGDGSPTGQSETVTLDGSGSYGATFDVSALDASVYKVISSTGAESGDVAAATCAPGAEIPQAPLALLLPLSMLGMLAVAGFWSRRRPRAGEALV